MPTTSPESSPGPVTRPPLRIEITGCGHIVSFKNSKMLLRGKNGSPPRLITKPEYQKLIAKYEQRIELALLSAYRTAVEGMAITPCLQSWIRSSVFLDDSLDWIPESDGYRVERVPKGEEGIVIEITRLT